MPDLDPSVSAYWRKLLAVGAGVLTLLVITTKITGELPEGWWAVAMITLLFSVLSISLGLVLGAVSLLRRRGAAEG